MKFEEWWEKHKAVLLGTSRITEIDFKQLREQGFAIARESWDAGCEECKELMLKESEKETAMTFEEWFEGSPYTPATFDVPPKTFDDFYRRISRACRDAFDAGFGEGFRKDDPTHTNSKTHGLPRDTPGRIWEWTFKEYRGLGFEVSDSLDKADKVWKRYIEAVSGHLSK